MSDTCGAPVQGGSLDVSTSETVLQGKVLAEGTPVGGAFVRLLDSTGEFTAEVVSSPEGDFRFFAAPGSWTVRALHKTGNGQAAVSASGPGIHELQIAVA